MKRILGFAILLFGFLAQSAIADVPGTINYQGRLTDSEGNAVGDGTYGVTFTLHYTAASNSPTGWSEVQNIATTRGYFNVALGGVTPLSSLDFSYPYYLEIHVAGDAQAMTPRQALTSVPYAMKAQNANLAIAAAYASSIADDTVTSSKVVNQSLTGSDMANNTVTYTQIADGTVRSNELQDGSVTTVKAPWAPTVNGGINYPKIACGLGLTDVNGDVGVSVSSYGFTSAPVVVATTNRNDVNVCVRVYDVTSSAFSVKTFFLNGSNAACYFYWVALGN